MNGIRPLLKFLLNFLIVLIVTAPAIQADWIEGYFSPSAGIDSLERFLVIRDIDDSTLFGWKIVACGDVDGDSIDDIIVCRPIDAIFKGDYSFLYYGGSPPDGQYDKEFVGINSWFDNIGDIDGDGFNDFGGKQGTTTNYEIFLGGPSMDNISEYFLFDHFSRIVRAADFDGDTRLELPIARSVNGGDIYLYEFNPNLDTVPEYTLRDTLTYFGMNMAVGDFNGDDIEDLAVASVYRTDSHRQDSNYVKFYWGGSSFDTTADYVIWSTSPRFGNIVLPCGDFNGDGYDDVMISSGAGDPDGIYFGGPQFDSVLDLVTNVGYFGGFYPPSSADVGDFNGDGYPDLLWGYYNPVAFVNEIYINLGGPNADSLFDVHIEGADIHGGQADFGREVRAVGDFNGDGREDFAVHSRTSSTCCFTSEVNLFSGWGQVGTDVPFEFENTLPDNYALSQNYPNPFNPTTTIEFSLTTRSQTSLRIFNALGEEVASLLNKQLSAGKYKVTWDGRDKKGKEVASGVYFYKLEAEKFVKTKKMMLIR